MTRRLITGTILSLALLSSSGATGLSAQGPAPAERGVTRAAVIRMLSAWPAGPRLAGHEMLAKYGAPAEATAHRMIWHHAGPFARILLTRDQLPHDFPVTHLDYLEHTIHYNVPIEKTDDLHAFDASMTIHRGSGELSARCDLESNNVLTLNLANDIARGRKSVAEARDEFGRAVSERLIGNPPPSTMALQFQPMSRDAAADREKTTIPGSPQRTEASTSVGRPAGDAQIMAMVIAHGEDEVHAAMTAEGRQIPRAVIDFAAMLHRDHGRNVQQTHELGLRLRVTPLETAATDAMHATHAAQLATIVPLNGDAFARAYLTLMVRGHRDALRMLDQWTAAAEAGALKQHLSATRAAVAAHLAEAQRLQRGMR